MTRFHSERMRGRVREWDGSHARDTKRAHGSLFLRGSDRKGE